MNWRCTLPYAKHTPEETPFLVALMSLTGIVVGIAFLALWMMQPFSTSCTLSNRTAAQVIRFAIPLELFKIHVGRYPHRLDELFNPCTYCSDSARWKGPYVKHRGRLKDYWDQDFSYQSPGLHNKSSYDLSSPGPDGVAGTTDDITNW